MSEIVMKSDVQASKRRQGLFVVFHDIVPTTFESQVLVHVQAMRNLGVDIELWVFPLNRSTFVASVLQRTKLEQKYGVSIQLFRAIQPRVPFGEIVNALRLAKAMRQLGKWPDFIHARTDYSTLVCGLVRLFYRFELIWDCRGDSVAEFGMATQTTGMFASAIRFCKLRVISGQRAVARRLSSSAIFVSELLKVRCLPSSDRRPVEIIPSGASEQRFFFSSSLRRQARDRFSIDSDQLVLVYAGSISFYQCFNETVDLFRHELERNPRSVFLMITPNEEEAQDALRPLPKESYRIYSAEIDQVNEYLNAGDFGVFLRRRNAVNDVASPIKFAEYCLAGLPVIMTDAVEQTAAHGRVLGNAVQVELDSTPPRLERRPDDWRVALAKRAVPILGRSASKSKYFRLYGVGPHSGDEYQS